MRIFGSESQESEELKKHKRLNDLFYSYLYALDRLVKIKRAKKDNDISALDYQIASDLLHQQLYVYRYEIQRQKLLTPETHESVFDAVQGEKNDKRHT